MQALLSLHVKLTQDNKKNTHSDIAKLVLDYSGIYDLSLIRYIHILNSVILNSLNKAVSKTIDKRLSPVFL